MRKKRILFGVMLSILLCLLTPCVSAVYYTHVRSEVSTRVDQIKNDMLRTVDSSLDTSLFQKGSTSWLRFYLIGVLVSFPIILFLLWMNRIPGQPLLVPVLFALIGSVLWPAYLIMMIIAFIGSLLRQLMDRVSLECFYLNN